MFFSNGDVREEFAMDEHSVGPARNHPTTGRSLHCQVEHHVRDKFATPILYDIDNLNFMIFVLHIHDH